MIAGSDISLDFERWSKVMLNRTLFMNAFLAFLYTHVRIAFRSMVVTPELVIHLGQFGQDDIGMAMSGNPSVSHLATSLYPLTYRSNIPPGADSRILGRPGLPRRAIQDATASLHSLFEESGAEGLLLADLFLRGSKAYKDHNHSAALINFWAVTERLLSEAWGRGTKRTMRRGDGVTFISGQRRKRLDDGRAYTAAVMIEIFLFGDRISLDLYEKLSRVRKARNDWIHSLRIPTAEDAAEAGLVCQELLKLVRGVELGLTYSLQIHGG